MLDALNTLLEGKSLSREQAAQTMSCLLDGSRAPEQIGAFLFALRLKQETVDEISGFVDCLHKKAISVPLKRNDVMDVCGTGGDGCETFNVSTAVTFVLAAAGQPVAKHGNRSVSSRSGSFDVLEAFGLSFDSDPLKVAHSLEQHGVGLLFAPAFHPSLKAISAIRKNLGVYTVFNALGPLLNPARVKRQLIGVYSPALLKKMALVLQSQGTDEAMVVHGRDGLDEISLSGPTDVAHLKNGDIYQYTIRPEDFGLSPAPLSAIKGGNAQENARTILDILKGEKGPKRDMILLNTAAALCVGGKAGDFKEGVDRASDAIDSGKALDLIRKMGGRI
jgi:anthranilate phosphoribosyltransferase